jgi:phage N-6-adenine-methyltransferase
VTDLISSDLSEDMKNSWGTDPLVFNALDKEFNFGIDIAASKDNALLPVFFTKEQDALNIDWSTSFRTLGTKSVWCNPPYGKGYIKQFFNKAIEQKDKGVTSVFLVPATLDAQWLPVNNISEIRIITGGRLSFYHPITDKKINGNTKGSMFVIFRPSSMPLSIRLINRDELLALGSVQLSEVA